MAEAVIKIRECSLDLEVSEFALVFAVFNRLLNGECRQLTTSRGIEKLAAAIRQLDLDHDWYRVFNLDEYLLEESDYSALQELVACSIALIRNSGYPHGVPMSFYDGFPGARFAPPFPDKTNWRAVAWPFVQVVMVPMLRHRLDSSLPLLKALGW